DLSLGFCSIGTAHAARPDFPLDRIELVADLLVSTSALNATVHVATLYHGLRTDAALPAARVMKRLAAETQEGFGNCRFAMLACVEPGCPFFPSAYHSGPDSLAIGLQGAGIVAEALRTLRGDETSPLDLVQISEVVKTAVIVQSKPVVDMAQEIALATVLYFGGIVLYMVSIGGSMTI